MTYCAKLFARFLVGSMLLLPAVARAQLTEGTIVGTVTDSSGAVVSGAKVSIKNTGTGATIEEKTDSIGYYRAPHLSPGSYEVRVEKSGFKTSVAEGVVVNVDVVTRADVALQVGSISESITVTEAPPLVQTEEGRLASTITTQEVTDLPLNGRQVYQLVTLEPGVTATNAPVISNVPSPTSSVTFLYGFIANGSNPRGNNFILDGNSNNNEWLGGQPLIYPSLDAIQEVQVQTLNFSAEYGRNNGAIVSIITKSGTNALHGTAFYSGRNTALDARNFFDFVEKTPLKQNQFGASLGGPIIKNNTFFFVNYEGSRLISGAPTEVLTENPAYRESVISSSPTSIAALLFGDFPGPNCLGTAPPATTPTCLAEIPQVTPNRSDQYLIRGDHNFSNSDRLFVRWDNNLASGNVGPQELGGAASRGFSSPFTGFFADLGIGYTHTFSASTLNDFRFSYSRNDSKIAFSIPSDTKTAAILKADGFPADYFGNLVFDDGTIPIGGNVYTPRNFVFNTFGVNDTFTHLAGRHSFKFGFEFRRIQENSEYGLLAFPWYEFSSIEAFAADSPYYVTADVNRIPGSPNFGDFTNTPRHFRWNRYGAFVQDDWKIRPHLTANLGVRWDLFPGPTETNGLLANINLGSGSTVADEFANATVGRVSKMWNTDFKNFAPRIGLAWDPTGKGTWAVRSGFSMAYEEPFSNLFTNASRFNPPDSTTVYSEPSLGVGTTVNYVFPWEPTPDFAAPTSPNGGVEGTAIAPSGVNPNLKTAYALQWFLGVQHEFLHNYGFSINYVGTRGVGGYTREDYNRFDGDVCNPTVCDYYATRLAPGWGAITYIGNESQSTYEGLNAQFKKSYSNGVMFIANYTFGKVLDNVTEGGLGDYFNVNSYAINYSGVMDIEHPNLDRGPAEFDVRHRFTGSAIWNIPSPKSEGALNKLLGGWQLNTIVTLQSGRPFDADCTLGWYEGCDFQMDGDFYARPNVPAGGIQTSGFSNKQFLNGVFGNPALTFYGPTYESLTSTAIQVFCPNGLNSIIDFGPSATCIPVGQDGNLGRNVFRGPAFKDVDLGLFKNTKVGERLNIQFRAEAFNLFNRVNLYNPVSNMGSSQFGESTAAFPSRQIQLGLTLQF
ncbi:MAG: carboxypeptidase regulatory-like domain-containing protein [Candidatus Acidiferrales bacterium]